MAQMIRFAPRLTQCVSPDDCIHLMSLVYLLEQEGYVAIDSSLQKKHPQLAQDHS